jgi:hypothetical protein
MGLLSTEGEIILKAGETKMCVLIEFIHRTTNISNITLL